jgi:hypothetical protein
MNYTVDYFIQKFSSIPRKLWCVGSFVEGDRMCALGHCGMRVAHPTPESLALNRVIASPEYINDGEDPDYPQPTPRARILAALRDVKAKELA